MAALIKNIHLLIIALAAYNVYTLWSEKSGEMDGLQQQIDSANASLVGKRKNKKEIQSFFKDINEAKDRIERVALEIEKTQQQLPSEINDGELIQFISKKAEELNIRDINITPDATDDNKGFFSIRKYTLKAKGTYVQFLILFENISDYKRILNIGAVTFNRNNLIQRSRFQIIDGEIQILAYKYNVGYKEDRGIDKIDQELGANKKPTGGARKSKGGGDE